MRWNAAQIGDTREMETFAILPIKAGYEWRWLEWVVIEQKFNGTFWENFRFKRGT